MQRFMLLPCLLALLVACMPEAGRATIEVTRPTRATAETLLPTSTHTPMAVSTTKATPSPSPESSPVPTQPPATPTETPITEDPTPTPTFEPVDTSVLGLQPSPPPEEQLLLSTFEGALVLQDLATGDETTLLESGLYDLTVEDGDFLVPILWPVRFSPDGRWLVVPTPRDGTWLVSADGQQRQQIVPTHQHVTWGPDSRRFAFTSDTGEAVRIYDLTTEQSTRLAPLPGPARTAVWSPDGSYLTAAARTGDTHTVVVIAVASGQVRTMGEAVAPPIGGAYYPLWTADSQEVIVGSWQDTLVFPLDGSGPRPRARSFLSRNLPGVVSPDGTLYAAGNEYAIRIGRLESGASVTIPGPFGTGSVNKKWTQFGRRLLLKSWVGHTQVWAIDPAVGLPQLVSEAPAFLGMLSELRLRHTETVPAFDDTRLIPTTTADNWITHDLPEFGFSLQIPPNWRVEEAGNGVLLANFDFVAEDGRAYLTPNHLQIMVEYLGGRPTDDFTDTTAFEQMEQDRVTAETITVDGRAGMRLLSKTSPVCERLLLPQGEGMLQIRRCPLDSEQAETWQQILASWQWQGED